MSTIMSTRCAVILALIITLNLVSGCGKAEPTATAVPLADTSISLAASQTPLPPTATSVPPTPTQTPVPPTATATMPSDTPTPSPSPTPEAPTATATVLVPPTLLVSMEKSSQLFGATETFQIGLGDLDSDGDLDAVFANMGANDSAVWMNDGTGQFVDTGQILTPQGHGVDVGDLDGDGDLDLFITCAHYGAGGGWSKRPSQVYLNDGTGAFQDTGQDVGDTELSGNGVNLIDIDGDGDLDAHVVYYDTGGAPDRVFLNDGQGVFTDSGLAFPEEVIAWGDLDADGDVDLFGKTLGQGYQALLNDGTGHFSATWEMEDERAISGGIALADLDGDGDLDALTANGFRQEGSYPTRVLLNDGTGRFSDSDQGLNETTGADFAVGDLDGDADLDVLVSNIDRPNEVWLNDGTGQFTDSGLRMEGSAATSLTTIPSLGDLDGDGDLDAFVGSFRGQAEIWFNQVDQKHVLHDAPEAVRDETVMVFVPGGTFSMGSTDAEVQEALARCRKSYLYCNLSFYGREAPQHTVAVDDFWLDQAEVTNAQYRRCVEAGVCRLPTTCDKGEPTYEDASKAEYPVVCVDWHDAETYCGWVGARLPTEAEWEYAARGPEGYLYPWGNEPGGPWQNYCDASCTESWADASVDDGYAKSSPVDSYPEGRSWCGAQDMAGNVHEWVADWMGDYPSAPQTNPYGPASGRDKVLRGSSWKAFWDRARGATRALVKPERRDDAIGFRCAKGTDTPAPAVAPATGESWQRTYGGPQDDVVNDILLADDGGYFIVGATNMEFEPEMRGDVYLIRTDADGEVVWEKTYGGEGYDSGQVIYRANDGGLLISGVTTSFGGGDLDAYLIKVDQEGNEIWSRTFGGPLDEWAVAWQTADGGYLLGGSIVDPNDIVADPGAAGYGGFAGRSNIYLAKIDAEGNEAWSRTFGGENNVMTASGALAPDGGFVILATIMRYPENDDDILLLRIDENGDEVWSRIWDQGMSSGYALVETFDGNYLVTGPYSPPEQMDRSQRDFLFIKFDPQGNEVWMNTFGDADVIDYSSVLAQTTDGAYIAAGTWDAVGLTSWDEDISLVKLDENGQPLWKKVIETDTHNMFATILQHPDGGYVIAVSTFGQDSFDILLIKTDSEGNVEGG